MHTHLSADNCVLNVERGLASKKFILVPLMTQA